jgi:hypothetical protein
MCAQHSGSIPKAWGHKIKTAEPILSDVSAEIELRSKSLTLGRFQASLVCSRLLAILFLRCGGDVLPFLAFAEDVGVGAGTVERDDVYLGVLLVEQQPVWIDVAF